MADTPGRRRKEKEKSVKVDEAQASARSCAGRPDFLPCSDGSQSSACTTHSHGRCFKLHWCCLLGWCHCKYVYQPMTNVLQLPSTTVPSGAAGDHAPSLSISALLADRFLRTASCLASPTSGRGGSGEDYAVTRINGRAFYVPLARRSKKPGAALTNTQHQNGEHTQPGLPSCSRSVLSNRNETTARLQVSDRGSVGQKPRSGFSPSGPEDSGIPGVERTYGDPELNQEHSKVGSEGLKEDRWDLSPLQELAEALETTV